MGRPGALPHGGVLGAGREELTDLESRRSTLWLGATLACFTFAEPLRGQQSPTEADSVVAIDPVTVEVGRLRAGAVPLARTPFPSQVVDAADLDTPGRRQLASTLSTLPGVTLTNQTGSGSQSDIRLRGFAVSPIVGVPQSVSVFVDGVRVNEADASQVHLSLIPTAALERIELVRGPVGVFGKNSIAGALNFVTRRAEGPHSVTAEIEGGSFGTWAGTLAALGTAGPLDGLVTVSYAQSEGWRLLQGSEELSIFAKAGWRGERTDAWVSYTFEADSLEGPGPLPESWLEGGPLPPDLLYPTSDPRRLQYTGGKGDAFVPRLHFLNAQADHSMSDSWSVQLDGFGRFADFRQTNDNLSEPDALGITAIGSFGSTLQLLYQPSDGLFVAGGLEWTRNDVDIEIHEVPNRAFPSIPQAITEHLKTDEDNLGVFGEAWWEVGDRLAVYGSLRYDHVSLPVRDLLDPADSGENTFSELSGGLGVSSDLASGVNVFASYGRGFRAPVILEVTCADPEDPCQLPFELGPDPPLLPVKSDTWQLGLRLAGARAEASLVGYWTDVRDDIFNVVDETTPTRGFFTNLDRTRRVGLEAAASGMPLPRVPNLRLSGSVAWTRATFESPAALASPLLEPDTTATGADDGPVVVEPGDRFPMVPELSASLGATYRIGSVTLAAEASWTGRQYLIGDEGNDKELARLAAFALVDVRLDWEVGRSTVFVELSNVLDADYAAFGIVSENGRAIPEETERFLTPGLPRRISAGVRAQIF